MPIWPFQRSRESRDADLLLAAVTRASRDPAFYGVGRAPDTLEGRFEIATFFASLALIRLKPEPGSQPLTQGFADALFSQFDAGLREAAVGDLAVPKRMQKLAGSFYGRLGAYAAAMSSESALAQAIGRNVLGDENAAFASTLASRFLMLAAKQADRPVAELLTDAGWKL